MAEIRYQGQVSLLLTEATPNQTLVQLTVAGRQGADRFKRLLLRVLRDPRSLDLSPPAKTALVVMTVEGLSDRRQLMAFLRQLQPLKSDATEQYVSWTSLDGRLERRKVSALTLHALRANGGFEASWEDAVAEAERYLSAEYDPRSLGAVRSVVDVVLAEGQAFAQLHVAPALFGHISGIHHLECLPASAWARRFSRSVDEVVDVEPQDELDQLDQRVLPQVYGSERPISGAWFIERLMRVFGGVTEIGEKRSAQRSLERTLDRLQDLALSLDEVGPVESLLLGWVLDMIRHGSYRKRRPRLRTLEIYTRSLVRLMHQELSRSPDHPTQISKDQWTQIYRRLLASESDGLLPAIHSFHRYMVRTHDAEPVSLGSSSKEDFRRPKANFIWKHELDRAIGFVGLMTADPRLTRQVTVWLVMLRRTGIRFGELIRLRLSDIHSSTSTRWWLHVDQASIKTEFARRTCEFDMAEHQDVMRDWVTRRTQESTARDELLFGDPQGSHNSVYKLGPAYSLLSQALKKATGDTDVVPHALRHTFASCAFTQAVEEEATSPSEVSQVEKLRAHMGHALASTTLETYCHLYEDSLRVGLDRLQCSVLRAVDVGRWLAQDVAEQMRIAATVRQRLARGHSISPMDELERRVRMQSEPAVDSDAKRGRIESTTPVKAWGAPVAFVDILRVAIDWHRGLPPEKIALRSNLSEVTVRSIVERLKGPIKTQMHHSIRQFRGLYRLTSGRWKRMCEVVQRRLRQAHAIDVQSMRTALSKFGLDAGSQVTGEVLSLLKDAGFSNTHFVVRGCDSSAINQARWAIHERFGADPRIERVCTRRGRPSAYIVVITSPSTDKPRAAAATSDTQTLATLLELACVLDTCRMNERFES